MNYLTRRIIYLFVMCLFYSSLIAGDRTVLLTMGVLDKLPIGVVVTMKGKAYKGQLDWRGNSGRTEFGVDDITRTTGTEVPFDFVGIADSNGAIPSKIISLFMGKLDPSDNSQKNIILFDVNIEIMDGTTVLYSSQLMLPLIVMDYSRDVIPACISVFHRVNPAGKLMWGVSRHNCEQPLDLSKRQAFRKQ